MVWIQDVIMAEEQPHNQKNLFLELKKRFPEVPDNVVTYLMRDNNFIRECCIDALGRESNKYLYSSPDNLGLENLQINTTPERQVSSNSGSNVNVRSKRSDSSSSESRHGMVSGVQPNNGLGSANTTPSSDIDVQALYGTAMYGVGSASGTQNGPYAARYNSHTVDTQGWTYPPQTSQAYQPGAASTMGRGSGQAAYALQSQTSGPVSLPLGHNYADYHHHHHPSWGAYDPRHQTPPPSTQRFPPQAPGMRTPSPQHYPLYPFEYPPSVYNPPGSPNAGRPVFYAPSGSGSGRDMPHPHVSQSSYHPSSLAYMGTTTTGPGIGGRDTSPSSSTSAASTAATLWYLSGGQGTPQQGAGSNTSTPTHSGYPVYSPAVGWHSHPLAGTPESEQGQSPLKMNGPLDARRGSEDSNYTQSLLLHQRARMEKLRHDLESGYRSLQLLETEVADMEHAGMERKNQQSSTFPTGEDVGKMRDDNRRLLIDVQLMTREIDCVNNGQTPLGVIDPKEQNFYQNIGSTGQRGSIHAGGDNGADQSHDPSQEAGHRVPPARPPPPTTTTSGHVMGMTGTGDTSLSPPEPEEVPNWSCSACTFLNHPLLNHCEFCEMPRINQPNRGVASGDDTSTYERRSPLPQSLDNIAES